MKLKEKLVGLACAAVMSFSISACVAEEGRSFQELIVEKASLKPRQNPADGQKLQTIITDVQNIYRKDPLSSQGYDALLFAAVEPRLSIPDRDEAFGLLAEHYADREDIYLALNGPLHWMTYSSNKEALLKAVIERNSTPLAVRTAETMLAGLYATGVDFIASLDDFDIDFMTFIDLQIEAMKNNAPKGGGKAPNLTRDMLLAKMDAKGMQVFASQDWRTLRRKANELLDNASKTTTDEQLYRLSYDANGRQATPQGALKTKAEGIQYQLNNVAPGAQLPEVDGIVDYEGNPVRLTDHKGKVLLLDFWATWCGPCKAAMPHHRELVAHMKGRPFELITFSVDSDVEDAIDYRDEVDGGMPFTNWWIGDDHAVIGQWGIQGFPTLIVVDHKGIIRSRPSVAAEELEKYLDKLVSQAES